MKKKICAFNGHILIIGCGSVSQCVLPLIIRLLDIEPRKITVLDFMDNRHKIADALQSGVQYVIDRVTPENFSEKLSVYLQAGDLMIDLAWNIDTIALLQWCRNRRVLYVNTSVEVWAPFAEEVRRDPREHTLYKRQMNILAMIKAWVDNSGSTAVVDHGANPGLVSHFTKKALLDIANTIITEKPGDARKEQLEDAVRLKQFGKIGMLCGVKTIHISERDTQITNQPKRVNEFVNTWSIEGLYEEGMAPAELGWGTHEKTLPANAFAYKTGPQNQICLSTLGVHTWVKSWVPSGEITGMVIRHGEAYGISERMTVRKNDKVIYRPTVHYAYCPSNAAINSLHELEMRNYRLQEDQRIMSNEIIEGRDELGVLLMGHDYKSWWCGSLLNIHDARVHVPGQQATTVQVAISVVACAVWMIINPNRGFNLPDDLDHESILNIATPFIEPFISERVNWDPFQNLNPQFSYNSHTPQPDDVWQFASFLVKH